MPISSVQGYGERPYLPIEPTKIQTPGFGDYMTEMIKNANTEMTEAEEISRSFAAGETNNIHETILAAEEATIAFKLVGTMRNRVLEAYQEVMRMSI